MRKEREATIKPGQAFLIVTYGNTTQKHRPLEGDLVVLGRSPSCDISLVSPEVAPVHCILQRMNDGWHLRDSCGGRHATRLNGRPVREEKLHDNDVIQIGAFSFEMRLPLAHPTPVVGTTPVADDRMAARLRFLQRSRRNLVRLALRLRRKARQASPQPPTLAELEQQAESLRGLLRDYQERVAVYDRRLNDLEKVEQELCDERAAFERECTERQARLDKAEVEMARRQEEMETQLKRRWKELQEQCRPVEREDVADLASQDGVALDRRSQELNYFARYLRRCRQQLLEQLSRERALIAEEYGELLRFHEEIRAASPRTERAGVVGSRLDQLTTIKQDIAGTSPSAPGDQLRGDSDLVTAVDLEQPSAD